MGGRRGRKRLPSFGEGQCYGAIRKRRDLQSPTPYPYPNAPKQQINLGKSTGTQRLTPRSEIDGEGPFWTSGHHSCVVSGPSSPQCLQQCPCPYVYLSSSRGVIISLFLIPHNRQDLRCLCPLWSLKSVSASTSRDVNKNGGSLI